MNESLPEDSGKDKVEGPMEEENKDVWQSVLDGNFKGFSVEGIFDKQEDNFLASLKNFCKNL